MANAYTHAFERDVTVLGKKLAGHPAKRWLLFSESAYRFAIAWTALENNKGDVVLPANGQSDHWHEIEHSFDAVISDQIWADIKLDQIDSPLVQVKTLASPNHLTITFYTSGSMDQPKAVQRSLNEMDTEVTALEAVWGGELANATVIATVPHYHIYGFLFSILWPLRTGRCWRSKRVDYPEEILAKTDMSETALVSSPSFLRRWSKVLDLTSYPANLNKIFSSGSALDEITRASSLGDHLTEVYGSTETGGIAYRNAKSIGWSALPGVDWKIADQDRLLIRSPWVRREGWQETGDCAKALSDSQFELLGRVDRVVKIEGKRVSLPAIEARLKQLPEILECRALPLNLLGREAVGIVVQLSQPASHAVAGVGQQEMIAGWADHLRAVFEPAAIPKRWRIVESWPENEIGKVSTAKLLSLFSGSI